MTPQSSAHRGPMFWSGAIVGWGIILFAVRGLLNDRSSTAPAGFVKWFVGLAVLHDALFAPLVLTVAWTVGRLLPRRAVVPVRLGLATTALLIGYSWPLVRGYGRRASNPSALPLDYERNLIVSLVVVWAGVSAWIAATSLKDRRRANMERPVSR